MTWAPLLLADPSPCLRLVVLRDLFGRPEDDPEVRELTPQREQDPLARDLLALQAPDGSWVKGDMLGLGQGGPVRVTAQALIRLGYLGFGRTHPAVGRAAEFLFSCQQDDGSWPLPGAWAGAVEEGAETEGFSMIPLQTALPLRGLAACGYATDPRAGRAYAWLLEQRLPDGAWPTGIASGNYGYVAGYRRLAHSRWGCRSNTTGVLLCLADHPQYRDSPEARRALDLLLGRETREGHTLGYEVARTIGVEPARGFLTYYARFDLAQLLDLCAHLNATTEDERVGGMVAFVREMQGPYGLWVDPARPQAARWVTFDLLRSLARIDQAGDWVSMEPRTPFAAYPRRKRRF